MDKLLSWDWYNTEYDCYQFGLTEKIKTLEKLTTDKIQALKRLTSENKKNFTGNICTLENLLKNKKKINKHREI